MFIIQSYFNNRRQKLQDWEAAREKMRNNGEVYYSEREIERRYPYPVVNWKKVSYALYIVIMIMAVVSFVLFMSISAMKENDKKPQPNKPTKNSVQVQIKDKPKPRINENPPTNGSCNGFNLNDHIRIQYGDYADKTGKIVGGCKEGEDYQVKLDDKQSIVSYSEKVDVGGKIIAVDTNKNLVVIKE